MVFRTTFSLQPFVTFVKHMPLSPDPSAMAGVNLKTMQFKHTLSVFHTDPSDLPAVHKHKELSVVFHEVFKIKMLFLCLCGFSWCYISFSCFYIFKFRINCSKKVFSESWFVCENICAQIPHTFFFCACLVNEIKCLSHLFRNKTNR